MLQMFRDIFWQEDGATAVEYAVMLALVIAVCFVVIAAIGTTTRDLFDPNSSITGAMKGGS